MTNGQISTAARVAAHLADRTREVTVADVRIGLGYTAVLLEDGRAGVAFTFRDQARGGCSVFLGLRPLCGRPVAELLPLLQSDDAIEAGVGLACANALCNQHDDCHLPGDILEQLDLRPDDQVGMVGHFRPLVEEIERRARGLTVFERTARPSDRVRPREEALEQLPGCQVALITATSIINHTVDELLEAARGCREVAVLGASTPLLPALFRDTPVTLLSGVVVRDAQAILRVVCEGGGMRLFGPHVAKVSLRRG